MSPKEREELSGDLRASLPVESHEHLLCADAVIGFSMSERAEKYEGQEAVMMRA